MHDLSRPRIARQFFLVTVIAFALAAALGYLLTLICGRPSPGDLRLIPWIFALSTLLLAGGSGAMFGAQAAVRRERQPAFRRWLAVAVFVGGLFFAVQGFGLWSYMQSQSASMAQAEVAAAPLAALFAILHAMHFSVALMFLIYVTVLAYAERYDHEYSWGIRVAAWFWHALGIAWLVILGVFIIVGCGIA